MLGVKNHPFPYVWPLAYTTGSTSDLCHTYLNFLQFTSICLSKLFDLTIHSFDQQIDVFCLLFEVSDVLVVFCLQLLDDEQKSLKNQLYIHRNKILTSAHRLQGALLHFKGSKPATS